MPIGTEDDLSSRHCRHSTTQGPSGRWIILGWCGLRTPTSCSSSKAPSPSGTLSAAPLRPQKSRRLSAVATLEPVRFSLTPTLHLHRTHLLSLAPTDAEQEAHP
jgi:hypothetical protein